MLTVRDLMAPNPIRVAPEDTLRAAADLLTLGGIGGAPVVTDGRVIGVVTLTDILAFEADDPGVVMPASEDGLEPDEEPDLDEPDSASDDAAAWFLGMWDVEGPDSVTRMAESEGPGWNTLDDHTVAEVMSRQVIEVAAGAPVTEAARIMERERIHRLIVVEDGALVGILSSFDLVRAVAAGRFTAEPQVDLSLG
jgi:signal-transduction protein with cAMP-binding, CBS, and nucleotidyltransferase domain